MAMYQVVNKTGGGGSIPLPDVTGLTATVSGETVLLTWDDPDDVVIGGITYATWAGTKIVRKLGSVPASRTDGDVVVDSTTRDQYSVNAFTDSGVSYGNHYYYRAFPYSTDNVYTNGSSVDAYVARGVLTVPTSAGNLTYNGSQQTASFNDYDPAKMTATGITGTAAGTYTAQFTPNSGYVWSDYTTEAKSVSWTIDKALVTIPYLDTSVPLVYTGQPQSPTWIDFDTVHSSVRYNTRTDAGYYSSYFSLIDRNNYSWTDGTTADINRSWSIQAVRVTPPTVTSNLTYNGSVQYATVSSYDANVISVTGISGTDAGSYTATLALIDNHNYRWTDETTADKTATWTIAKAPGDISLSKMSVTLDTDLLSDTVTVSGATGTVSVSSADTSIATATISGSTITISSVNDTDGDTTVTVSVAESTNYLATSRNISVECDFNSLTIVSWANGSDAEVAAMLEAHYAGQIDIHDYWSVGDERVVNLSAMAATGVGESHAAQSVTLVLSNVGGKTLATPVSGKTTCAFQVDQKHSLNETGYMNSSNTNTGGWKSSARRTWCNSVYKNAIPSTLRGIFKEFINQSGTGGGSSSGVENTTDTFALRAEIEVFGSTTYSVSGEGSQVTYYQTSSNRIKQVNGSNSAWWGRSPRSGDGNFFCRGSYTGTSVSGSAYASYGLAPFGCI